MSALLFMCVHCVAFDTIEQKFLEPGHTQMEVDSIHSTIDARRKHLKVSSPYEWPVVLQMARRDRPYNVHEVSRSELFDLHRLPKATDAESDLKKISWMKVKCIRYTKSMTSEIEIKERYTEPYKKMKICSKDRSRSTRKSNQQPATSSLSPSMLKPAYLQPLPVPAAKKADLLKLCKTGVIQAQFRDFYEQLPASNDIRE